MSRGMKIGLSIVAVLLVGGGVVAFRINQKKKAGTEVRMQQVAHRDLVSAVTASGKIEPKTSVDISADITGRIIRIAVRKILTRFRLTVVPGSNISAHVESTMLVPTGGVPMIVGPPDGQFVSCPVVGNIHELVDLVEAPAAAAEDLPRKPR